MTDHDLEARVARMEADCHRILHRIDALEQLVAQLIRRLPEVSTSP